MNLLVKESGYQSVLDGVEGDTEVVKALEKYVTFVQVIHSGVTVIIAPPRSHPFRHYISVV